MGRTLRIRDEYALQQAVTLCELTIFVVVVAVVCLSFNRVLFFRFAGLDIANQICAAARCRRLRVSSVHTSAHIDIPAPECCR